MVSGGQGVRWGAHRMVSERAGRWGFHRMLSGVVVRWGVGCCQLWLILVVWVYPAGGATVSQEEKGSQAE